MHEKVTVKEASVDEAVKVNDKISEFGKPVAKEFFENRYKGKKKLIIVAYVNNHPAGYIIGYDHFEDGSFYCWMAGVDPQFRGRGILKQMMEYHDDWARKQGYSKIRIKTRNNKRAMLSYLVKYGYSFTSVEPHENIEENRIFLEKKL